MKTEVSKRTLRHRNNFLKGQIELTTGGSTSSALKQTATLVKSFSEEDRETIVALADIPTPVISAKQMVAMKIDTSMPWDQLKKVSR